jgi:hypothetical protein
MKHDESEYVAFFLGAAGALCARERRRRSMTFSSSAHTAHACAQQTLGWIKAFPVIAATSLTIKSTTQTCVSHREGLYCRRRTKSLPSRSAQGTATWKRQ